MVIIIFSRHPTPFVDVHVPAAELEDLIGRCLVAAGASPDHAPLVAKVLFLTPAMTKEGISQLNQPPPLDSS